MEIRVTGTVQGVGFRPTVWRLANEEGLAGEVLNDSAGVLIRAAGEPGALDRLLYRLRAEAPPLSRIESIHSTPLPDVPVFQGFRIRESVGGENRTRVTPDAAMCGQCRHEILTRGDRRFGYPFANCTHCGPRFSIVRGVPYDRSRTTMSVFALCEACAHEYHHPPDRRFHAQPTACAACGPQVWIERPGAADEHDRVEGPEAIDAALASLRAGRIVALRGLGASISCVMPPAPRRWASSGVASTAMGSRSR
ncbi:acylphosphatase [Nannocystis sp.]|uniref:acylphosphatase n=1 Tax=Nannocystis sp. TaxID=1962667 RepID=UPI0025DF9DEF|nr:acylphosphatase [Nannocystis sp.]